MCALKYSKLNFLTHFLKIKLDQYLLTHIITLSKQLGRTYKIRLIWPCNSSDTHHPTCHHNWGPTWAQYQKQEALSSPKNHNRARVTFFPESFVPLRLLTGSGAMKGDKWVYWWGKMMEEVPIWFITKDWSACWDPVIGFTFVCYFFF